MNYPIAILDLETTGVSKKDDRIVEICVIKMTSPTEREVKRMFINPEMPIPAHATEVHGIRDEDVKDANTFKQISKALLAFIQGCDILGYNSISFDIPMLYYEFRRADLVWDYSTVHFMDACVIFKRKEERTLTAAVKFYLNKDHEGAHGAQADCEATIEVMDKQLQVYEDLSGKDNKELALYSNYDREILDLDGCFTKNDEGVIIFNFGKHKGKEAKTMRPYLEWMNGADFMPDTKRIVNKILWNK